jgi:hypothetical protein
MGDLSSSLKSDSKRDYIINISYDKCLEYWINGMLEKWNAGKTKYWNDAINGHY